MSRNWNVSDALACGLLYLPECRVARDRGETQPVITRVRCQRLQSDSGVIDVRVLGKDTDGDAVVSEAHVVDERASHRAAVSDRKVLTTTIDVIAESWQRGEARAAERLDQAAIAEAVSRGQPRGTGERVIDPHVELIHVVGLVR